MATVEASVLLVEDDERISRWLADSLQHASFAVEACADLGRAREALEREHDLLLLDLGLPDGDGLDLCRSLRASGRSLPIIVLTARDAPTDRVRGLDAGADDYIVKPFHLPEVLARIRSVLRRSRNAMVNGRIHCGELWADGETRKAGVGERALTLKRREFDLLLFLLRHLGRAWTRDQLLRKIWGFDFEGDSRTVDLHVGRLRAQIENDPSAPRYIETVWGVGYRMPEQD